MGMIFNSCHIIEKEIYILENRKQRLVQAKEQLKVLISSKTVS